MCLFVFVFVVWPAVLQEMWTRAELSTVILQLGSNLRSGSGGHNHSVLISAKCNSTQRDVHKRWYSGQSTQWASFSHLTTNWFWSGSWRWLSQSGFWIFWCPSNKNTNKNSNSNANTNINTHTITNTNTKIHILKNIARIANAVTITLYSRVTM